MSDDMTTKTPEAPELEDCPFCRTPVEVCFYADGDFSLDFYHEDWCILNETDLQDAFFEADDLPRVVEAWNRRARSMRDGGAPSYAIDPDTGLMPCPFCGESASIIEDPPGWWSAECGNCASKTALTNPETAKSIWNSRAATPERTAKAPWDSAKGWRCACGHVLHGYPRYCGMCGSKLDYQHRPDAPKAVLD